MWIEVYDCSMQEITKIWITKKTIIYDTSKTFTTIIQCGDKYLLKK